MRISSPGVELEEADTGIESGTFFQESQKGFGIVGGFDEFEGVVGQLRGFGEMGRSPLR